MAKNVRQRMIAGAGDLLSRRGLQSTSFAEVTQATGTPRGSIYHHFPGGKQELVLAALDANIENFVKNIASIPRRSWSSAGNGRPSAASAIMVIRARSCITLRSVWFGTR